MMRCVIGYLIRASPQPYNVLIFTHYAVPDTPDFKKRISDSEPTDLSFHDLICIIDVCKYKIKSVRDHDLLAYAQGIRIDSRVCGKDSVDCRVILSGDRIKRIPRANRISSVA
ncbi:hypothetical protein SDC9_136193 [bioreactor metagenome]|uniref:Uncharacterized protein n=1 Tax=bioreactor metagenome TaxID=1076179 RepID=A0A645DIM2_9ZZZZ